MKGSDRTRLERAGFKVYSNGEVHFLTCRWCAMQWVFEGFGPLKQAAIEWLVEHAAREQKERVL